jgi:hypothetical protein
VDIVRSFAGANAWGLPFAAQYAPSSNSVSFVDHGLAAGQGYDYGFILRGHNGHALNATPVLISHTGSSPTVSSSAISAALLSYNEFGGTIQSDGSVTGVDSAVSRRAFNVPLGTTVTVSGVIAKGSASGVSRFFVGTVSSGAPYNGYSFGWQSDGTLQVHKWVSGTSTNLNGFPVYGTSDTNPHSIRLSILTGATNTIEGVFDAATPIFVTDSSVNMATTGVLCVVYTGGSTGTLRDFQFSTVAHTYLSHPPLIRGVINDDGSAGKTQDWLPDGATYGRPLLSRLSSGKPWIDFSESIHANKILDNIGDGSTYARVKSSELSSGAVKQLNDGTYVRTAANVAAIVDSSGNMPGSGPLKVHIPNSLANLVSNIQWHSYSASAGSLVLWFTSLNPSNNPAGSGYPSWTYPDGSGGIYPSAAACGSSSSSPAPGMSFSGLSSANQYIGVAYEIDTDTFSVVYGPSTTVPTDSQVASAVGDGKVVTVLCVASSGTTIPATGGGGSSGTGGSGHIINKF